MAGSGWTADPPATAPAAADPSAEGRAFDWKAIRVAMIKGCHVPECALPDPETGDLFISNVQTATEGFWVEDGQGYISRRKADESEPRKWRDTARSALIHAPKGMCLLNGVLYAADISRVLRFPLQRETQDPPIAIDGARRLNDMATDGKAIYVSDTANGQVYRIEGENQSIVPAPRAANGITFWDGKMYGVSWSDHDVYELDPEGRRPAKALNLARYFRNLDGIEALEDGTLAVSDFVGNKVCLVSADRSKVATLVPIESPADIGVDRKRGFLYIPQFHKDQVAVYKLEKTP
jgi:DNA-binding beta-propeller fold protein YncE